MDEAIEHCCAFFCKKGLATLADFCKILRLCGAKVCTSCRSRKMLKINRQHNREPVSEKGSRPCRGPHTQGASAAPRRGALSSLAQANQQPTNTSHCNPIEIYGVRQGYDNEDSERPDLDGLAEAALDAEEAAAAAKT